MRKGVILEVNDLYVTLLTPEGEFLRTRKLNQEYEVGEEIHFFPTEAGQAGKRKHLKLLTGLRGKIIVLVSSIILASTAFAPIYQNQQVYAYMSIDVNPSIELGLNNKLQVISIAPYNKGGDRILSSLEEWKGKDAAAVAEQVLEEIEKQGYLKEKDDVLIATVKAGESKESIDQELEETIAEIKETGETDDLDFKVLTGTAEERETAVKEGVTTGIYKEKTHSNPADSKKDSTLPAASLKPVEQQRETQVRKAANPIATPNDKNPDSKRLEKNSQTSEPAKAKKIEAKKVINIEKKMQQEKTKQLQAPETKIKQQGKLSQASPKEDKKNKGVAVPPKQEKNHSNKQQLKSSAPRKKQDKVTKEPKKEKTNPSKPPVKEAKSSNGNPDKQNKENSN